MMSSINLLKVTFLFLPPFIGNNVLKEAFEGSESFVLLIDFKDFFFSLNKKLKEKILKYIKEQSFVSDSSKVSFSESEVTEIRTEITTLIDAKVTDQKNLSSSFRVILKNFPLIVQQAISLLHDHLRSGSFVTAFVNSVISAFNVDEFKSLESNFFYCPSCLEEIDASEQIVKKVCLRENIEFDLKKLESFRTIFLDFYYGNSIAVTREITEGEGRNSDNSTLLIKSDVRASIKKGLSLFIAKRDNN